MRNQEKKRKSQNEASKKQVQKAGSTKAVDQAKKHGPRSVIVSPEPPGHPMENAAKESVASHVSVLSKASKADALRILQSRQISQYSLS